MKEPPYRSLYAGVCPACGKRHMAGLNTMEPVMPPPVIKVCCQCQIPVVETSLTYQGSPQDERPSHREVP